MEDTNRNRAGQLVSSSYNLAKTFLTGSKTRLKEAQSNLDKVVAHTESSLNLMGLNVEPAQLGKPLMPETSSVIGVPQVYGRNEERDLVIERLGVSVTIGRDNLRDQVIQQLGVPLTRSAKAAGKKAAASTSRAVKRLKGESSRVVSTSHVPVLPVVGIGGVGKTTLAQYIYSDARVKTHFDVRLWVCVSDIFDKTRITKEIIETITSGEFKSSGSLDALQVELKKQLMSQKFVLVLDDVWQITRNEWESFFAPFRLGHDGSMVLLTTRFPRVAQLVSTVSPIELEGLPADIFWEFFKKCAFGEENPELYPQLQVIGQSIADRLRGSPLAAKTLGRLLSMELTQQNWRQIQNSELWQLSHEDNEILPALQLSYLYLPQKLKRCFAVCSIFPKDYSFESDEIVAFWVAQCFVESEGTMRLEDIGRRYLDDLRGRFLFQTDPKFPKGSRFVMHDLIHDMAQSVSVGECFLMQDLSYNNLQAPPHTVRHMSIEVDNEALSRMGGIQHLNRLRSLRFRKEFEVEASWFNHLSNILFLSLKGCKLVNLPESICELSSLRFLDISGTSIQELPEKLWCLYSLQYFYANPSRLRSIHPDIIKLVNLRRIALPSQVTDKLSKTSGLGNLSSLQNLRKFTVGRNNGQKISELKAMNQLGGVLSIWTLLNIQSREEAAEARLVDKRHLSGLILDWQDYGLSPMSIQNGVLEGLHPPSSIDHIKIIRFRGDSFPPSWLKQDNLPALRSLSITNCFYFKEWVVERRTPDIVEPLTTSADGTVGGSVGVHSMQQVNVTRSNNSACLPFISLTALHLHLCQGLTNLDQCLSPDYLRSIQSIQIALCWNLKKLPVHKFGGFVSLRDLKMSDCNRLVCPREMVLPPSLQRLSIGNCGELDRSMKPGCLENLASLSLLCLEDCPSVDSILLNLINTNNLKGLVLRNCSGLSSIGGSHALSSIKHVDISDCPKLTEVQQPFLKKELRIKWENELFKF